MSKGSPSPKSPYVMARISPKSPYIMAAKSPKSPMLSEKYKSGCAWGLISIFNFRQDRSSKKLISDRRGLDKRNAGNRHTRNMHNALSGADEKCQVANDGPHNKILLLDYAKEKNVKSFMDKDKSTEQKVKKSGCVQPDSSSVGYVKKHRTESKPSCVHVNGCKDAAILGHNNHKQPPRQISVDELLHKLDSAATTASFHSHHRHGRDDGFHKKDNDCLESNQLIQANDLAEAYVNQKFINGKFFRGGGPSSQSKQFLDALQILNSNKELFVKLLQDPNSLLVKHIEELRDAQAKQVTHDAQLPEHEVADASQPGEPIYTQKFRRQNMRDAILKKVKLRDNYPPRGVEDPQSSSEIVILKPGSSNTQNCEDTHCSSLQSHYPETEEQSTRPTSLTLGGFRRKLRHAIGVSRKEQHQFSDSNRSYKTSSDCRSMEESDKGIGKVMVGKSSLNEIDSESVMKWKDKIVRTKSFGDRGLRNSITVKHHNQSEQNIPTKAGKQDLEMPGNGNEGKGLPEEGIPKANDQTRFSESRPNSSRNPLPETKTHESICYCMDNVCSTGSQRIIAANDSISPEESNLLELHSELNEADINTSNSCMDSESLELSKLVSPPPESVSSTSSLEVSSSALLSIQKVEDENIKDGSDQPSPVSVLERFCIEDTSIPADIISQSAELPMQPQQISFEEQCFALSSLQSGCQRTLSTCIDEHGSLTDYVRSVVQAASLNWDEVSLKCDSPDQLLEPSIYDEFGVSCSNHGLLFDCINEILIQVYQYYFRCSHGVSFMKPKIRPFSVEEHVVHEVVKCFDCYLLPQPPSQTLECLAETDLAKSMAWMDIHIHAEETVTDIAEAVLQELVMETVSQLQV